METKTSSSSSSSCSNSSEKQATTINSNRNKENQKRKNKTQANSSRRNDQSRRCALFFLSSSFLMSLKTSNFDVSLSLPFCLPFLFLPFSDNSENLSFDACLSLSSNLHQRCVFALPLLFGAPPSLPLLAGLLDALGCCCMKRCMSSASGSIISSA